MICVRHFIETIVLYSRLFFAFKDIQRKVKAEVALLIWERVDFRVKNVNKDKEDHFAIIKRMIHQEDTIPNVFACVNKLQNIWSKNWYNCTEK